MFGREVESVRLQSVDEELEEPLFEEKDFDYDPPEKPAWWDKQNALSAFNSLPRAGRIAIYFNMAFGFLLIVASYMLLFGNKEEVEIQPVYDVPQILNSLPWNPAMSGLTLDTNMRSSLYPSKLGNKLLLLDVDTRPWKAEEPANMSQMSWGRLNHYLYAQMHGYDYKYYQAPDPPAGIHPTWVKVDAIREALKYGYRFVVFTDYDVIFPRLKVPMEWLLDHWNVTEDIAMTVGLAQDRPDRYDRTHHQRIVNTGFMVVQNTPIVDNMFDDWSKCVYNRKYKDCSHWMKQFWHEQSAYSDYIRYDYPNKTREVPCDEVSGSPEHDLKGDKHCDGTLVRHYFMAKNKVREAVQASIAELVLPSVVDNMMQKWTVPR